MTWCTDLGSRDGRIVIAAARRHGARGVGIDIDPARIAESERNAQAANVVNRVRFVRQDLFDADIGAATVVTLYLLPRLNQRLRPKLLAELKPGTRVVSYGFDMSDWVPERLAGVAGAGRRSGSPAAPRSHRSGTDRNARRVRDLRPSARRCACGRVAVGRAGLPAITA